MLEQLKSNNVVLVGLKKVLLFPFSVIKYSTEGIRSEERREERV